MLDRLLLLQTRSNRSFDLLFIISLVLMSFYSYNAGFYLVLLQQAHALISPFFLHNPFSSTFFYSAYRCHESIIKLQLSNFVFLLNSFLTLDPEIGRYFFHLTFPLVCWKY